MILRMSLFVGLIFALHGAAWLGTSIVLKNAVQDWIVQQTEAGFLVRHDEPKARISGYPFVVNARLQDVILGPSIDNPEWVWQMDHLDLQIVPLPFVFDEVHFDVKSRHTITSGLKKFIGEPALFEGKINWMSSGGLPEELELDLQGFALQETRSGQKLFMDQFHFSAMSVDEKYEFSLKGNGIDLIQPIKGVGRKVDDLILRGFISEPSQLRKIRSNDLTIWRDAGGTIEVERLKADIGTLVMQGNGTLALDGELQPVGALTARFEGFFQTVDRLSRAGLITGPNASMAKVVLGALAKRPQNGGPLSISLPITIQDRGFYAGPLRLAQFPRIMW